MRDRINEEEKDKITNKFLSIILLVINHQIEKRDQRLKVINI